MTVSINRDQHRWCELGSPFLVVIVNLNAPPDNTQYNGNMNRRGSDRSGTTRNDRGGYNRNFQPNTRSSNDGQVVKNGSCSTRSSMVTTPNPNEPFVFMTPSRTKASSRFNSLDVLKEQSPDLTDPIYSNQPASRSPSTSCGDQTSSRGNPRFNRASMRGRVLDWESSRI